MLGKKKKLSPDATDSLIGEGSVFEGRIKSEASLHVEGNIIGDIDCLGDVTIGAGGHARSDISARHVTIAGTVIGNVSAAGTLVITATGKLIGNAASKSLVIEEGGIFEGTSRMHASDGDRREDGPAVEPAAQSAASGDGS